MRARHLGDVIFAAEILTCLFIQLCFNRGPIIVLTVDLTDGKHKTRFINTILS